MKLSKTELEKRLINSYFSENNYRQIQQILVNMEKKFLNNKIRKYIQQYNIENTLLEYGKKAKNRGYYNRIEFIRISLWKSTRQKKRYKSNSEKNINKITKETFLLKDEMARMRKLCTLKGVGIPVASALLTFHSITRYAIIDIRCVQELQAQKLIKWKHITPNHWVDYIELLRCLSRKMNLTPRNVEKGIFAYHREKQVGSNFQNLR